MLFRAEGPVRMCGKLADKKPYQSQGERGMSLIMISELVGY